MTKRLIVSHCYENLEWLNKIGENVEIIIYHKDEKLESHLSQQQTDTKAFLNKWVSGGERKEAGRINQYGIEYKTSLWERDNVSVKTLSNVGRESHTYLFHIVENYENLSDLEVFSQGIDDHDPLLAKRVNETNDLEYRHFPYVGDIHYHHGVVCVMDKEQLGSQLDFWDALFPDKKRPDDVDIMPCAIFKISRDRIRMHPKEFYENCLRFFVDNEKNNVHGWSFEYLWAYIFHTSHSRVSTN